MIKIIVDISFRYFFSGIVKPRLAPPQEFYKLLFYNFVQPPSDTHDTIFQVQSHPEYARDQTTGYQALR